jgi:probable HAF family extracellular repeat protein
MKMIPVRTKVQIGGILLLMLAVSGGTLPQQTRPDAVPRYSVTMLGKVPFVADDLSLGLNDTGQTVGWKLAADRTIQPVRWQNGKEETLPLPLGFRCGLARVVNAKGQAAGWASDSLNLVDSQAKIHAVLFDSGKAQDLGTLGGKISQAFGLNNNGAVVGVSTLADGKRRAFLWQNGTMTALENLPDGDFSAAYAVNDKGEIAGVAADAKGTRRAVLWRKGEILDLGTLPDGESASARAINAQGAVVGFASVRGEIKAFLWQNGTMTDLSELGRDPTAAWDCSERLQVVGSSSIPKGERHAFLWQNGTMTDLNTALPAASGWTLVEAHRISRRGQIVGIGLDRRRQRHAFLLTPLPPP